jgi:hypothetical protein
MNQAPVKSWSAVESHSHLGATLRTLACSVSIRTVVKAATSLPVVVWIRVHDRQHDTKLFDVMSSEVRRSQSSRLAYPRRVPKIKSISRDRRVICQTEE